MSAIAIKPHVGIDTATGGEVQHDVDVVTLEGREVAYLSKKPAGLPNLILLTAVSESDLAAIVEACQDERNATINVVNPPPDIPPEFSPDEVEEEAAAD